jgi:hypothetical protein
MVRPIKQVAINIGHTTNLVNGEALILNPNTFPGPLQSKFQKPYGSVAIDIWKGWTAKALWGYYGYHEQFSAGDTTGARSFRGNLVMLSLRYSL